MPKDPSIGYRLFLALQWCRELFRLSYWVSKQIIGSHLLRVAFPVVEVGAVSSEHGVVGVVGQIEAD